MKRNMRLTAGLLVAGMVVPASFALATSRAGAAAFDTALISRASGVDGPKANASLEQPDLSISGDGRLIAFESTATNLDPSDASADADVFVRDRQSNVTTLVSRATGASGGTGVGPSIDPSISADGRYVAFASKAAFDPLDTDADHDIYVRDLQMQTTTLATRGTGPLGENAPGDAGAPAISADGRYVSFESAAGYTPADGDGLYDVYVRDLAQLITYFVSQRTTPHPDSNPPGQAWGPSISHDGRMVAFSSTASLDPADTETDVDSESSEDVYVRDLQTDVTTLVSRRTGVTGAPGEDRSTTPAVSGDGRYVAFHSQADLDPPDATSEGDVYVRDLQAHTTRLVSRADGSSGARANRFSNAPSISFNGRFIAFHSMGTNIDPADTDTLGDTYLRDMHVGATTLLSRAGGPAGVKGNDHSRGDTAVAIGARFVAFASSASNLHPHDGDHMPDVFVRELPPTKLSAGLVGVVQANLDLEVPPVVGDVTLPVPPLDRRVPSVRRAAPR